MNKIYISILTCWIAALSVGMAETLVLKASKDNFGRSNKQNRNSGACEALALGKAPNICAIIAFDLSSVTNEIVSAELKLRQHETSDKVMTMVVAPMVFTTNNAAWVEGRGNLGAMGQNALVGESCYAFSAFKDVRWESAKGEPLGNMSDPLLWEAPIAVFNGQLWQENRWFRIPIKDVSLLETCRKNQLGSITFGAWGKSGSEYYFISSRNSEWSPELHLVLKEEKKNEKVSAYQTRRDNG